MGAGRFGRPWREPRHSPVLLQTPAGPALEANQYISGSSIPSSADNPEAQEVLASFKAKNPGKPSNAGLQQAR